MPAGIAIGAGTTIASGIGAYSSNKAAKTQANAARDAANAQLNYMRDAQARTAPYTNEAMDVGRGAITSLAQLYGIRTPGNPNGSGQPDYSVLRNSPDYQFSLQEGNRGVEAAMSKAYGGIRSGNAMRGISEYNQGLASTQLGNYFNRVMSLANLGQGASATVMGQANAMGQVAGNGIANEGQARAAGIMGMGNAFSSGIQGLTNTYALSNILQQQRSGYAQPTGEGMPSSYGFSIPHMGGGQVPNL